MLLLAQTSHGTVYSHHPELGPLLIAGIVGMLIGAIMLLMAFRANRRKRLVDDLATSKTSGVFIGLVEVKGTAESEDPLTTYLAEIRCVHYEWSIDEHWSRTVTETYTDSEGNTKTRTRHESGWKTVASGGNLQPFYLRDEEGVLRIVPDGAEIRDEVVFSETVSRGDPLYYGKGPDGAVMNSDHRRRFVERAIPLHHEVYVVGQSRLREDVVAPEIAHDREAPLFLISAQPEEKVSSGFGFAYWGWAIAATFFFIGGWIVGHFISDRDPAAGPAIWRYLSVAFAFGWVWAFGWLWTVYNSLVALRNRYQQARSNVDVQLKRRHDLIPNIVQIVQATATHERDVHETVAMLRAQGQVSSVDDGDKAQPVATRLIGVVEAYPELKSNDNFLALQEELIDTEQRIALARAYFNDTVMNMNIRVQRFPDVLIAKMAQLSEAQYIAAEDFERASVKVNLSTEATEAAGAPPQEKPPAIEEGE